MELIDGKKIADTIKAEIAAEVEKMVGEGKKRPHLAAVLVGHEDRLHPIQVGACVRRASSELLPRDPAVDQDRPVRPVDHGGVACRPACEHVKMHEWSHGPLLGRWPGIDVHSFQPFARAAATQ